MKKGFTLIEILIVISIIGIFSTLVFGSVSTSRSKARDNSRITDMKQMELALALYYDVNKQYPPATTGSYSSDLNILVQEGYIPSLPADPQSGNVYQYKRVGNRYCIGVNLEGAMPSDTPEVQTLCNDSVYYWASR